MCILQWLTAVQFQHHLMQVTVVQCWCLQEFVESMGVVSVNLEEASGAPVTQAILGNTAMKVSCRLNNIYKQGCILSMPLLNNPINFYLTTGRTMDEEI